MLRFDGVPTTIIGSLPGASPADALDLLDRYPLTIPAWPQLPKRSFKEGMVGQFSEGFPGVRVDEQERKFWIEQDADLPSHLADFYERVLSGSAESFAVSAGYAAGLAAFLERRGSEGQKLRVVKGQVAGPFTVGLSIADQTGRSAWFDDQYRDVVIKGLAKKAVWQAGRLSSIAEGVIIFFDEPIFAALGTPAYIGISDEDVTNTYSELCEELHGAGAMLGVHCCGNMDWSLLARSSIDILSFDAYSFGDKVALYAPDINSFLMRGGWLAWGLVPTGNPELVGRESARRLVKKFDDLAALLEQKGIARDRLISQMLLTPSCGMGTLPMRSAERVLELLHQLRQEF
jgi:methionine synthase II (cobalamin-independent)